MFFGWTAAKGKKIPLNPAEWRASNPNVDDPQEKPIKLYVLDSVGRMALVDTYELHSQAEPVRAWQGHHISCPQGHFWKGRKRQRKK